MINDKLILNKQQLARIEQIVLDQDEKEALKFLTEINKKLKVTQVGCDPLEQKMREGLDTVVNNYKKNKA